ncbi:GlxA family transcriptional regulator [Rhizobium helianthi]|uniref:GlxA family transcriptional regulator n=1 Tax=Rhizobium helianthi TaxID=1132695 RepID=A0ABW4MBE8_9HYPH
MPNSVPPAAAQNCERRSLGIVAYNGVNLFEMGLAMEIFSLANDLHPAYRIEVCAERAATPLRSSFVGLVASHGLSDLHCFDTVIVPGWIDIDEDPPLALIKALKKAHASGSRIVSICSGVFLLAEAGLLDGRRAAVHWSQAQLLAQRFPKVKVDPKVLYVDEGDILSSAGRAAGLDLCLHIVRKDHGGSVARAVAQRMVIPAFRTGDQTQYIPYSAQTQVDGLSDLCAWLLSRLKEKTSVDDMAQKCRMSRRTFIRRFQNARGMAPAEWLTQQRLFAAKSLLEDSIMPVEHIAAEVGFPSADVFRHHFRKQFQMSPASYRKTMRDGTSA